MKIGKLVCRYPKMPTTRLTNPTAMREKPNNDDQFILSFMTTRSWNKDFFLTCTNPVLVRLGRGRNWDCWRLGYGRCVQLQWICIGTWPFRHKAQSKFITKHHYIISALRARKAIIKQGPTDSSNPNLFFATYKLLAHGFG